MIKMRLIRLLKGSGKYILYQVLWQWISLIVQIIIAINISLLISKAFYNNISENHIVKVVIIVIAGVLIRCICDRFYTDASFHAGANVKRVLRNQIYEKVLRLGPAYREQVHTSEIVQMAGEGVEQLEVYFSRYLSQFFYSLLAPLTLFIVVMKISMKSAVILLIAVPLIPIVIMLVMIVAKRLLSSYFDIYYGLGDSFLEKLQGMTTLKIYQADKAAAEDMDRESEQFRKITMKVLMMQLNSTSVMDIVAYGGAAVGIISALAQFYRGEVSLFGMLMILFLAAEFFLPMRILGSFFHIGMNGMKASDRIFAFIDLPEQKRGDKKIVDNNINISLENLSFSYEPTKEILKGINMNIPPKSFVSLVGVSGSGKSSFAQKHFEKYEIVSSDICRGIVSNDENNQSATNDAFEVFNFILSKRLQNGLLTVADATNIQQEARKKLLNIAHSFHVLPVAIVFDLPQELCEKRNEERTDRKISSGVLRHQMQNLKHSLKNLKKEGFKKLYILRSEEEVNSVTEIIREKLYNDKTDMHGPFDIIGDVHGCYDELIELLQKLNYKIDSVNDDGKNYGFNVSHPENRTAVFLGDLVDRGPASPQVLKLVMSMVRNGSALCVPGNHDMKLHKKLNGKAVQEKHGLAETLQQLENESEEFKNDVKEFLYGLVSHYVLDSRKLVVAHAGLNAGTRFRSCTLFLFIRRNNRRNG